MSKALKCDRCGMLYEKIKTQTSGYFVTRYSTGGYPLDLCPVCREEFKNWFDEKDKEEPISCITCKHVGLRFSKYEPCISCKLVQNEEGDLVRSNYERNKEVKEDE